MSEVVIIAATAFLPTANKTHASMLSITAGALVFPPVGTPGLSAYLTSKLAVVKMLEFLAAENPNIFVASVHPGMVDTGIFRKSGAKPETLPMDSGEFINLPLAFCKECPDRFLLFMFLYFLTSKPDVTHFLLLRNA